MAKKIIAIANHKGGVGKTTSVASIGAEMALRGYKTLLLDLDAQQNLTSYFLPNIDSNALSVYDSIIKGIDLPIVKVRENLYLTPSVVDLGRIEVILTARKEKNMESILRRLLDSTKADFDYIIIDCPPSLGLLTTNALTASTEVLIPLTAEAFPLRGLKTLDNFVKEIISKGVNSSLKVRGIFFTRYNNRKLNNIVVRDIKKRYGSKVLSTMIRENISLAETPITGTTIGEYAPNSNGAKDYKALTSELLQE